MLAEGRIAFMGSTENAIHYFKWYTTKTVFTCWTLFMGFILEFTKFKFRAVFVEYREHIVSFKCIMRLNV